MSIAYSLMPRKDDPRSENPQWKVYATAQRRETVTLEKLAEHIASHNSVFSKGVIVGLLMDFERCVVEQLKNGNRVDLGDLGAFFVTLTGRGANTTEEYSTDLIDHINVRWRCSKSMDLAMQRTPLHEVVTRARQRTSKKESLAKLTQTVKDSQQKKD